MNETQNIMFLVNADPNSIYFFSNSNSWANTFSILSPLTSVFILIAVLRGIIFRQLYNQNGPRFYAVYFDKIMYP